MRLLLLSIGSAYVVGSCPHTLHSGASSFCTISISTFIYHLSEFSKLLFIMDLKTWNSKNIIQNLKSCSEKENPK